MKLVVLIPSADYLKNGGARIRYLRLSDSLGQAGIELILTPIDAFDSVGTTCDVAVVSKCYDARAFIAAAVLSDRGIPVGVDLFDDYFSEESDSRLSRYRRWLRQMLRVSDFALCSTPFLAAVVKRYRPDVPVHVLSDPAPAFDPDELAATLQRKVSYANSTGAVRMCWFGIGDNPYFPVGLSDVAAFSDQIAALAKGDAAVELTVLTNKRALDASGLAALASLPIPPKVEEWSEAREAELLNRSFVCFLPVSAQPFSVAKSLNRALTALTAGCQVLSSGFPLYAELDEWIYRGSDCLLHDLAAGTMRLSPQSVPAFGARIAEIASADREAAALIAFLTDIESRRTVPHDAAGPVALLHGSTTTQAAHAMVKQAGGISVGLPFCTMPLEFDAAVKLGSSGRMGLLVATSILSRLEPKLRRHFRRQAAQRRLVPVLGDSAAAAEHDGVTPSLPLQLALYDRVVIEAATMVIEAFGTDRIFLSEESPLPLEPAL
jgi:hypothetical protein